MIVSFHPEAETEFNFSIDYYEDCSEGLGADFALEVYSAVQRILEHPKAWTIMEDGIRRCLTRRFPFGVLYTIEGDDLFILALMNLHRDPDYWKKRM